MMRKKKYYYYSHNCSRTALQLMNLKTELKFKGYQMERTVRDGWYYIGVAGNVNYDWIWNWEALVRLTVKEGIDSVNEKEK